MLRIAFAVLLASASQSALADAALEIRTLSSRADLVSGGDALVEVRVPGGTQLNELVLTLNDKDVTSRLSPDPMRGSFVGLVDNLRLGTNELIATLHAAGHPEARLTLMNHPITGPILSGAHLTPYECRTVESGLGEPLDANCSAQQRVDYFYRASDNTFKPLGAERPGDLVNTTTNDGRTVPICICRAASRS